MSQRFHLFAYSSLWLSQIFRADEERVRQRGYWLDWDTGVKRTGGVINRTRD